MSARPDLSIIIPTHQRAEKAATCIASLARQSIAHSRYEVLVGLDGPDRAAPVAMARAWTKAGANADNLRIIECPREGLNPTRNRLLSSCQGEFLLSLNDDVIADHALLESHLDAQQHAQRIGLRGACVTGSADWKLPAASDDTLMDRLVRETSMVFFYDQMRHDPADPDKDWGFRHCWGLNFSIPTRSVTETGGFTAFPLTYGHDDIELAWRCKQRFGFPVWFRPEARVTHDHRYTAPDILKREHNLGVASFRFAKAIPEFGQALFNRDVTSESEMAYSREFVQRERATAERLRETFLQFDQIPATAVPPKGSLESRVLIDALYQQHLLLKRYCWRQGLLEAASL